MDLPQLSSEELGRDVSPMVIGVVSMCLVIATGVLALRLWTRHHILQKIGWDDYAASFALLSIWGCGVSIAVMTRYGLGRHQQTVNTLEEHVKVFKCFWCSVLFYGYGHLSFKMAFLAQYYNVLRTPRMRNIYIAAMVLIGLWGFGNLFVIFQFCDPLVGFWDPRVPARCMDQKVLFYAFSSLSIATDVIIYLLPLPALSKLKIPRSQKNYLLAIFSLGFFVVVIAVIRIRYLDIGPDFTWANVEPAMWSMGELTGAMVCLCLPTLKALGSRLGLVATDVENPETSPSANQNIGRSISSGLAINGTGTTNSPRKPPIDFANFVQEGEQFHNGVFRQTPSLPV
ncbi:hypothetical protein CGRA01v4_02753 [Colletotrichum graminicola]|uniref:Rhodopsin domain-containing protein n=1 Tax=Colletotrichum graminicola (strain M1.001 / M2 / FGSC 10212) TaxID=645133 RepID=E3QAD1_COLGM|nr:uncharacterized protein GLRG_02963 [Colletotrichum graminicola M1.001]EFQ27819.1 hypothetical protein GLRG_02963 [Colletotrichum graminicola M1.001]WDK11474.1 hypothetical protein CGRA01v4_02753 [Colletotrichum graminicola]